MMWERCRDLVEKRGCKVLMNTRVAGIRHENGRAVSVIAQSKDSGPVTNFRATTSFHRCPFRIC